MEAFEVCVMHYVRELCAAYSQMGFRGVEIIEHAFSSARDAFYKNLDYDRNPSERIFYINRGLEKRILEDALVDVRRRL